MHRVPFCFVDCVGRDYLTRANVQEMLGMSARPSPAPEGSTKTVSGNLKSAFRATASTLAFCVFIYCMIELFNRYPYVPFILFLAICLGALWMVAFKISKDICQDRAIRDRLPKDGKQ